MLSVKISYFVLYEWLSVLNIFTEKGLHQLLLKIKKSTRLGAPGEPLIARYIYHELATTTGELKCAPARDRTRNLRVNRLSKNLMVKRQRDYILVSQNLCPVCVEEL